MKKSQIRLLLGKVIRIEVTEHPGPNQINQLKNNEKIEAKDYLTMADATGIVFHSGHDEVRPGCFYCKRKIDEKIKNWIKQNNLPTQEYFILGRFGKNQEFLEEDKHCGHFMVEVAVGGEEAYKEDEEGGLRPAYPGSTKILVCSSCTEILESNWGIETVSGEFQRLTKEGWQVFYI